MTTQEVANAFHELAQTGSWTEIQEKYYCNDCVSIEPEHAPGPSRVQGRDALNQKAKAFGEMIEEMHSAFSHQPQVVGNHFSVHMGFDATMKGRGRVEMEEIAVYEVKDGKIVKEQFFF